MNNRSSVAAPVLILFVCVLGCNFSQNVEKAANGSNSGINSKVNASNANKSITEKAMDKAVGEETVGIPACDDALEMLSAQASDPNDGIVTQSLKKTALNRFKSEVRTRLEQQNASRASVEKFCSDFKSTLSSSSAEDANANQ